MATAKPKRGRGRPAFVPTEQQKGMVFGMALWNVPLEEIRKKILTEKGVPLSKNCFREVFRTEIDKAFVNIETNLATALYLRGMKGSDYAATFILTHKFAWKKSVEGIDDGDIHVVGGLPSIYEEGETEVAGVEDATNNPS